MKKHVVKNFFGKAVMSILVAVMIMSCVCFFDGEGSVAYASSETYYITEEQTGLTITDNMTAPKPTTEGKETYIFAGYYAEATCETPIRESTEATVYKKFVPADIMSVKAQVTKGTAEDSAKTDMRLVTTVDSLDYKEVGFDVYFNGATTPVNAKTTTVYKRIIAADNNNSFGYSPEAFSVNADYFTTVNLVNIANKNFDKTFFIKPYWKTLDGTKVYGISRMARVSDSYNKIINVPVRLYTDDVVTAGTFDVDYTTYASILTYKGYDNGDVFASIEAVNDADNTKVTVTTPSDITGADGMIVNLRFQVQEGQTMPSNATFTVTSDYGTALANVEYRTFSVTYAGVPDTSWYDEFKDENEFVLTTPADFYGFAKIVNDSTGDYYKEQFADDTVRLGADVIMNEGNAGDWSATNAPANKWTPIGYQAGYRFQGTFDGCGNTINGIYCVDDYENRTSSQEHYTGLFGITALGSTVRNFSLTNSYFESSVGFSNYAMMGSIVGQLAGNIDTVYSDAIVKSAYMHVGGIVGRTQPGSDTGICTITNCWFDGSVTVNEETCKAQGVGGILGKVVKGKAELTDCLNTANTTYTATAVNDTITSAGKQNVGVAGLCGHGSATMTNCVNTGTAKATLPTGITVQGVNYNGTRTNCIDMGVWNSAYTLAGCNGYLGYTTAKELEFGFYDWATDTGNWVCRATADDAINGIPVLKSFCDEWIDVSWYYENTDATEFTISHAEEFYGWSEIFNEAGVNFASDVVVKLGDDIKLNNGTASVWATTENTAITDSLRKYTPIGNTSNPFAATFDGGMYTISGIYLNTTTSGAGLFGTISQTGNVCNLYIKNSLFESTAGSVGSVAGISYGTISTVYSDAYVTSSQVKSAGIVGNMKDTASVDHCWFDGDITLSTGSGKQAGGIVGYIDKGSTNINVNITNCLYTGQISFTAADATWALRIGGIVGGAHDYRVPTINLENCVSAGTITQNSSSTGNLGVSAVYGGLDGAQATVLNLVNVYAIEGCFEIDRLYDKKVDGPKVSETGTIMAASDLYGVEGYKKTLLNFETSWAARSGNVPGLMEFVENPLSVANAIRPDTSWYNAEETRQEILDEADMYGFMELMAEGNTFAGKEIYLMADLTKMNKVESGTIDKWKAGTEVPDNQWAAGTKFAGTFDGQMHTISGIYLNTTTAGAGLFGEITATGNVRNVYIKDSMFKSTAGSVGSVAGISYGTISTVYSDAVIVSSQVKSGGIVGNMKDTASVASCWYAGDINLTTKNGKQSGGIVGYIDKGTATSINVGITNCLYTGEITFEATDATWALRIGGIVGGAHDYRVPTINLENCISAGTITQNSGSTDTLGVSAVYGGLDGAQATVLKLTNVYAVEGSFAVDRIYAKKVDGPLVAGTGILKEETELQGTAGYQNTLLDFEDTWVARAEDVPALKAFINEIGTMADLTGVEQNNWYDADETVFGIASTSALKAFSTYSATYNFTDKTVLLLDDIEVNAVEEGTLAAWKAGTGTLPTSWTPIGATKAFAGTFDGQMHTISGVYLNTTTAKAGLFGEITATGEVCNFYIKDSFFKSTTTDLGSVAGISRGTISTVFSDAIVVSSQLRTGGIVGSMLNTASVDQCWFDGVITLTTDNGKQSGGIVGYIAYGTANTNVSITNCLYTGDLTFTATAPKWGLRIGGIAGGAHDYHTPTITIENCLSAGTVKQTSGSTSIPAVSTVYGGFDEPRDVVLNLVNVYGTNECSTTGRIYHQYFANASATGNPPTINGTGTLFKEADLYGTWGYQNTALDFENAWVARSGDVPGLKAFADASLSVADTIRPDTSWYDAEATDLEIQDAADMYGFMQLLAEGKTFEGQTIKVMADLEMNPTDADTVGKWQAGTTVPDNKWVSSYTGKTTNFAGTFDGQNHTISGIYCVGDYEYLGLFGTTLTGSTVKNFKLTNSYFKQTGTGNTGSIAGEVQGTIEGVYTDAIVEGTATHIGGIAALTSGLRYSISTSDPVTTSTSTDENEYTVIEQTVEVTEGRYVVNIKNCWFDGVVNATTTAEWARIGGIVASPTQGRLDMDNCLFTGTIYTQSESANTRVGGFVGTRSSSSPTSTKTTETTDETTKTITKVTTNTTIIYEDTKEQANTTLYIDSSIAAGQIINSGVAEVGSAVGYVSHGKFTNVFVTRDTYPITHRVGTTFEGQPIQTYNTDRLIGYCVEPTCGFKLDFTNDWSMRNSGVPVPKVFESVAGADKIVNPATLTAEIGLDTWSKTLEEAVDYGMGNYVVSCDATYDTYSTYLTTLGTLGFAKYADNSASDMDDDGVYNAIYTKDSGGWVLDITFVQNEGKIYISISTIGAEGLSANLQATDENIALANATNETTKDVSFSMLELVGEYGNAFIFKLPNGHFMINDGGKVTESEQLLSYLKELAGSDKVVIDAWVITHTHEDHCGVAQTIFDNDAWADVQLNAIYITEANDAAKLLEGASAKVIGDTNLSFRGLLSLTQEDGVSKPAIHRMHMGERYYFSGLTMDVVQAHEQIALEKYDDYGDIDSFNYTSTNCVYTLTTTGKKILIGGDSNNVNMQYMMMAYGKNYTTYNQSTQAYGGTSKTLSNINVFVAYHHGKNVICTFVADRYDGYVGKSVATNEWADYLLKNTNNPSGFKFDAVLFPYKEVFDMTKYTGTYGEYINIWVGDDESIMYPYNMTEINKYYINNANAYYTYGYEDYVDGVLTTAETRHGTVQFIYKEDKSVETVVHDSNITQ